MNAIGLLCVVLLLGLASEASAQPAPSVEQEVARVQQENADRWRRSRLVGAGDSLAIELPGGELISVAPKGCAPPLSRGGVIQVDCAGGDDGVVYYFDEVTRAMIEPCGDRLADPKRCPPPRWPI